MHPATFTDYALSGNLSPDETYTVECLIDHVRMHFDPNYWDGWTERMEASHQPDYQPRFDPKHVKPAELELRKLTWISLQKTHGNARPVRDVTAIRYFPGVTGLSLGENEIRDLSPLAGCANLERLHLKDNPISDISALASCRNLKWLDVWRLPIEDFLPIQDLPLLRQLEISIAQLPVFRRMAQQLALHKLDIGYDDIDNLLEGFDSFEGFPWMPELRCIRSATVRSLDGLERFPKLQNLVNLSGAFTSLEPLRQLKGLTHANILKSNIRSLEPLRESYALRALWIKTNESNLDLKPLEGLPALHEVTVKCRDKEPHSLAELRASLESWDVEFQMPVPRCTPSLELEVVDEETFSRYDTKEKFNITEADDNEMLLAAEHEWLNHQFRDLMSVGYEEDEDYCIPDQWHEARSTTFVLLSDMVLESLPGIIDGIQKVLCHAKRDWIVYLQSHGSAAEFVVWVYPNKLQVAKPHMKALEQLMKRL